MSSSIDWPTDLPTPRVEFRRVLKGDTIRTPFEAGYVQTRARSTRRIYQWGCSLDLDSRTKIDSFETFFMDTVEAGAESFNWDDPDSGDSYEVRFSEDEISLQYVFVDHMRVSFKLEQV